jgi:non-ribosomal peptide synthetase component E (peptide arylation enzyme)
VTSELFLTLFLTVCVRYNQDCGNKRNGPAAVPGLTTAVGLPDPETGERACAVVVPARPDSPPGLASLCEHLLAQGLSTRKLPEQLELVAALPRNAMGKIVKRELTAQFTPKETS